MGVEPPAGGIFFRGQRKMRTEHFWPIKPSGITMETAISSYITEFVFVSEFHLWTASYFLISDSGV